MENKTKGKIVRIISNLCTVEDEKHNTYNCKPRGKFYIQNKTPLVGDNVIIDKENNYILEILARKNSLKRPQIANVDICLIVTSVKEPNLNLYMLDKLLSLIIFNKITPVICFSKIDLLSQEELKEFNKIYNYYSDIGINTITNTEIEKLNKIIQNKVIVLTGQSGAGKSSLLNKLDPSLKLETNEISKALGRGKHTTRHTETFKYNNAYISDTPGFSSLELDELTKENIKDTFIEFSNDCKYRDCNHIKEENCEVKRKVKENIILKTRYDSYVKLVSEVENMRILFKK